MGFHNQRNISRLPSHFRRLARRFSGLSPEAQNEIAKSFSHCDKYLMEKDPAVYRCLGFLPPGKRSAVVALRAFNSELLKVEREGTNEQPGHVPVAQSLFYVIHTQKLERKQLESLVMGHN